MKSKSLLLGAGVAVLAAAAAFAAQDRYSVKVPNGLAFAEFRGYETWQVISISHNGPMLAVITGNPAMIEAYKAGIPANGKPFPDGAKMAKIHWKAKKNETAPGQPLVRIPELVAQGGRLQGTLLLSNASVRLFLGGDRKSVV